MDDLANRVLALAPNAPGSIDLFTSNWPNGANGLYPSGSAMAPAAGTPPTTDEARAQLASYLYRWFDGETAKVNAALAVFDDDNLEGLTPPPTLRAAIAAMKGTLLEPTIDHLLTSGEFIGVAYAAMPQAEVIAFSSGTDESRRILVDIRYQAERFEYLIGIMGHEFMHDDGVVPRSEEVVLNGLSGMTYMQVLAKRRSSRAEAPSWHAR